MGDMEILGESEARTWQCNSPYYHQAHTWTIVTTGLSRKVIHFVCDGKDPQ